MSPGGREMLGSPVTQYGITLNPPGGWEALIYRRPPGRGETSHPVVHAANFALPPARGDYGSGAVELMTAGDVFFCLLEFHRASATQALFSGNRRPAQLVAQDLSPNALQRALPGQYGVQRFFTEQGRAFCLYVVVAGLSQATTTLVGVNHLIQTFRIDQAGG